MNKSPQKLETLDQEKKSITVKLNNDIFFKLKALAEKEHRSKSAQLCFFIEQGFSNLEYRLNLEQAIKNNRRF